MGKAPKLVLALAFAMTLLVGCSTQSEPTAQFQPEVPAASPDTESDPAAIENLPAVDDAIATDADPERPAGTVEPPPPATALPPAPEPPPTPPSAPSRSAVERPAAAEPAPLQPSVGVVDIGGPVEVAAPKPGLTRIGSGKCKICHKLQYASWAETAHATRTPPLDCEGCHGPGSEYKSKKVMEDPDLARSAGLVTPERSFCTQCHTAGWTDDLMRRAHAHAVEGS